MSAHGSAIEDLLRSADARASTYAGGDLGSPPRRRLAIVTCMDARIDPVAIFDLEPGDAHVIRNAGGLVTEDVLRSLAMSQALLGTREVLLMQHTRCGVQGDEEQLRDQVAEAAGAEVPWPLGAFADVDASVRAGVEALRSSPVLLGDAVARGFVFDIETGRLREVT